jgi:hypothetical protein
MLHEALPLASIRSRINEALGLPAKVIVGLNQYIYGTSAVLYV